MDQAVLRVYDDEVHRIRQIRLECLRQATNAWQVWCAVDSGFGKKSTDIVASAAEMARFVLNGDVGPLPVDVPSVEKDAVER